MLPANSALRKFYHSPSLQVIMIKMLQEKLQHPFFQALFLGILSFLLGLAMAVPVPGPDRPMKQADYAALSHPANTKTVYASARVEQAVPLSYRRY